MTQFSECELGVLYDKFAERFQQRKLLFLIIYLGFVFYLSIPSFLIPVLEYNKFRITGLMEQRAIENFMLFYPHQSWVNYADVNPNLFRCIIGLEDGKFFKHKGIDWYELEKSMRTNKRRKRIARGGSTITMQLAKNLFLSTDRNVFRKAKELLITCRMEKEISKEAILENYINAVEWGEGIFGAKESAKIYFGKKPGELNISECTRMAAVIPSPLLHEPSENSRYVSRRASRSWGLYNDVILPE
ncbi:MAG: transglycosylase domain-containing protein [Ignavibacteriales bacterium]|nr:transglycosylase domain-containing protein [Ignavibacteriales bacterium]